jgi:hypothetical protein
MQTLSRSAAVIVALFLTCGSAAAANNPTSLPAPALKTLLIPANPITTRFAPGAQEFPVGQFSASLSYSFEESDGVRFEDHEIGNNVEMKSHISYLKLRYGLLPGLDIRSKTPFYRIDMKTDGNDKDLYWLGDTTIIAHKALLKPGNGTGLQLAFDFGGTVPTAHVDSNSYDYLGNHAWGLYTGFEATWFAGRHRIDQEVNFSSFSESNHDYRKPDVTEVNTAWAYAMTENFDAGVESNFEWNGESSKDNIDQDDAMFEWFAGPKIAWEKPEDKMLFGAAFLLPVYRYYDAPTPSEAFRVEIKVSKLF